MCSESGRRKTDDHACRSFATSVFRREKLHVYDQEDDKAKGDRLIFAPDQEVEAREDGDQENGLDGGAKVYVHLLKQNRKSGKKVCS